MQGHVRSNETDMPRIGFTDKFTRFSAPTPNTPCANAWRIEIADGDAFIATGQRP